MSSGPSVTAKTLLGLSGKKQAKQQQQWSLKLLYSKIFFFENIFVISAIVINFKGKIYNTQEHYYFCLLSELIKLQIYDANKKIFMLTSTPETLWHVDKYTIHSR